MSDIKDNQTPFPETRTALAEYVDSMLRVPVPEKPVPPPDQIEIQPEEEQEAPRMLQCLKVQVDNRYAYIPMEQIKSLVSLGNQVLLTQSDGPLMGSVKREGRDIPIYDLGWIFSLDREGLGYPSAGQPQGSQAVILRGQHFALACDRVYEFTEIPEEQLRESRDQRPNCRWIQAIVMDGMVPVLNIPEIKAILRSRGG